MISSYQEMSDKEWVGEMEARRWRQTRTKTRTDNTLTVTHVTLNPTSMISLHLGGGCCWQRRLMVATGRKWWPEAGSVWKRERGRKETRAITVMVRFFVVSRRKGKEKGREFEGLLCVCVWSKWGTSFFLFIRYTHVLKHAGFHVSYKTRICYIDKNQ